MDRGIYVPGHSKKVTTKPQSVGIEQLKSIYIPLVRPDAGILELFREENSRNRHVWLRIYVVTFLRFW